MHPLMSIALMPDGAQLSRDAAERHAARAAREERAAEATPERLIWRLIPLFR